MLGINSNINSLVAQQNLNGSQNALSQAITRLSSGKRINSAADDAAGLAIATRMQTQINGLNQGVSNANDGVSMIQTASSGLSQITSSLQRIRQLAVQASSGSLSSSDQQALQTEVTQQIAEVNRIASQTNYNGKNLLDGSAGNISFQVGANVGQTIGLNLSQSLSAASLGGGLVQQGSVVGTLSGLSLNSTDGSAYTGSGVATLTSINVLADGKGGFTFTDQNNQALSSAAVTNLFGGQLANTGTGTALTLKPQGALNSGASASQTASIAAIQAANAPTNSGGFATKGTVLTTITPTGAIAQDLSGEVASAGANDITSIQVLADGNGGYSFKALNGTTDVTANVKGGSAGLAGLFTTSEGSGTTPGTIALSSAGNTAFTKSGGGTDAAAATAQFATAVSANYTPPAYKTSSDLLGTIQVNLTDASGTASATPVGGTPDFTSVNVYGDGNGGYTFKAVDKNGVESATETVDPTLFTVGTTATTTAGKTLAGNGALTANANANAAAAGIAAANANNQPGQVADINISTTSGANLAMETIDNALATVNNMQANLGAAQNRFTAISTTQQAQATNLSQAQSQIQDANFAQETANLSKAQVLQQAGISVLAQANSLPQQVLKLLQ
ncbi:flagellin [Burkholderia multivorans]|nr:flagellin [Burkholderia multivorans]PRF35926.1 flagellin [Burkholderia multivorans]